MPWGLHTKDTPGKGRVLVVDDEKNIRDLVRMTLTKAGYDVVEAEDGGKAAEMLRKDDNPLMVDVITCDIRMPKVNGVEAIAFFRKEFPSVPVVVITGFPETDMAVSLFRIPHGTDTRELLTQHPPDLIINATNDPAMDTDLQLHKPDHAQVLGQMASRLLGGLAHHERELRDHLIQTEKMATIGTLVAGISHEINNPLYIMMGFSEHVRDETRDEGIRKYADAILQAGQRIADIVRDLNIFAQQPRSETLDEVDINQRLAEAVKMARRTTIQDDVSVVAQYGSVSPIHGRPDEILQLFLNLVTNAVQSMQGRGTLTLTTHSSDGYIFASVKDTGPGIPPH